MHTISVRTTQNVFINYPIGSLGDRILAYLLDAVFQFLFIVLIVLLFQALKVETWWIWILVLVIPLLLYPLLFEIFMNGQTPGKQMMKIRVVRLDGTPATVGNYILRWIFIPIDIHLFSGLGAVIAIAVGGKGQRIGDLVAGTTVVKLIEQQEISADKMFVTTADSYVPVFSQVTRLTNREIEIIQKALEVNRDQGNMEPVLRVTDKVKSTLEIDSDLPPVKFLYTVIRDFNHYSSK